MIETIRHQEVLGYRFPTSILGQSKSFSQLFFVDGLLIDTAHRKMKNEALDLVKKLNVSQILITHHHEDHTGNLNDIQTYFNCPVYASKECVELMKNPPKLSVAQKLFWGNRPANHDMIPIQNEIKTEHYKFQLIPVPGHAKDMLALYEPNQGWLFSADLFIHHRIAYFLEDESIKQQIQSLKTVLDLDFEVMFCSHNPLIKNGKQKLKDKLHFLEDFVENVLVLHQKGHSATEIFQILNLKEPKFLNFVSKGKLSKMNMVHSVIRDYG